MLTPSQISSFEQQGFLKLPEFCPQDLWQKILATSLDQLKNRIEPLELEAELNYPGAPELNNTGSETVRRLKQAYDRAAEFREWVHFIPLTQVLSQLLGSTPIMARAHHNCVMTKQPEFSSDSWWHQDLRYWRYSHGNLISCWLALGLEVPRNGCLQVIPGSHRMTFNAAQFDEAKFFRQDLAENQKILNNAEFVELNAGDVLLFHCKTLHAATRNHTDKGKLAAVFTFRTEQDQPIEGSRSASFDDVVLL